MAERIGPGPRPSNRYVVADRWWAFAASQFNVRSSELVFLAISPGSKGGHGRRICDLLPMSKHESYDGILRFHYSR